MRVLLATPSSSERLHNLVPLGWALRAAGHEVQVAGAPAFTPVINATGLVAVAVAADGDATGGEDRELARHLARWQPDVVVHDEHAHTAATAAASVGALSVRMLLCGSDGGTEGPGTGPAGQPRLTIDPTPEPLRAPLDPSHLPVRHVPYAGSAELPGWLRRMPKRPRVALTLRGEKAPVGMVLAVLGTLDVDVVAALPVDRLPQGTAVPDNIRLFDTVPTSALLDSCSFVVHDGGVSAVADALSYGLPQVVLVGDDSGATASAARRLAEHGAALVAEPDQQDGAGAAGLVRRLVREPQYREAAARLRHKQLAVPSPRDLVQVLAHAAANRADRAN
ncbi:nucleotide disphospho-sugar-binding domain-containing protein [Streptomyces sp. 21So2-11]|uniref:nucleotide disphospho-sugar-binding domain-containing protein n=1 Tax=Streptomyces sp. 21So2-11 TaxID=3144408 RepID=UPI003219094E